MNYDLYLLIQKPQLIMKNRFRIFRKAILTLIIIFLFNDFIFPQATILISQGGTVNVSTGDMFYDAGGAAGNDGNTDYTITLSPSVAGEKVGLRFTYFKTHFTGMDAARDALVIYDGTSATGNNIAYLTGDYSERFNTSITPLGVGTRVPYFSGSPHALANGVDDQYTPGVFTSISPSGSLTLQFVNGSSQQNPGWVAEIFTYRDFSVPGCNIDISSDNDSVCPGNPVILSVSGSIVSTPINTTFNDQTVGTGWSATASATFVNSICGSPSLDNSYFLWMQNEAGPRSLVTNNMNVSEGGTISFEYRQPPQNGSSPGSPCEAPDYNTTYAALEGIYLQYSTNGGTSWSTIKYLFPHATNITSLNGCGDYVTRWTKMVYPIPAAAQTASTRFRWHQPAVTSASTDNWGLDNIIISSTRTATITVTNQNTGVVVGTTTDPTLNLTVNPGVQTTYRAVISDGVSSCYEDITINMLNCACPTANAGQNDTICLGNNTTIGGSPTAVGGSADISYQWSPTAGLNNAAIANPTASPTTTTTYTVTVTDNINNCTSTSTVTVNVINPTVISYPSSPYSNSISTPQPITHTGGPATGSYTSTPVGLTINATTGAITPSTSTVGTYTVSLPTACGVVTTQVTISCGAFIGNISVTNGTSVGTNEYNVASGDTIFVGSSGFIMPTTSHIVSYAIFNCDPGVLTPAQLLNLQTHPCYIGSTASENPAASYNAGGVVAGLPGNLTTVWIIPYTRYPGSNPLMGVVNDGTGCYDMGETIQINYLPPACASCSAPTCPIAGPYPNLSTAASAANQCSQMVNMNPDVAGTITYVSYYSVTTSPSGTSLGVVVSNGTGTVSPYTGACNVTRTAELFTSPSTCATAGVAPTTIGTTFFNPEWTGLNPNTTYIVKVTTTVNAGCQLEDQCASYYSVSIPVCGSCTTPDCPIIGVADFASRNYPASSCQDWVPDITNTTLVSHYTVTSDANGFVGMVQQIQATPSGCETRTAVLRPLATACNSASNVLPSVTNANAVGSGFNPEWYGLTPNTDYVVVVTTVIGASCNVDRICTDFYGCTPPATPTATPIHPSCNETVGSITVNSPTGANFQYSSNGINYQTNSTFSNLAPGMYSITVKNSVSGCVSAPVSITINNPPVLPTAPTVSSNGPICSGENAIFTISGANNHTVTFSGVAGNPASPVVLTGGTATITVAAATSSQTLTITSVSDGVCTVALNIPQTVVVNQPVLPSFTAVNPICNGAALNNLPTTSNNGVQGTWTPAMNNQQTTEYTFTPNVGECATTNVLTVVVNPLPVVTINSNVQHGCQPLFVNFSVSSNPQVQSVAWNFSNGATSSQISPNLMFVNSGTYDVTATVTDINSCVGSATEIGFITVHPKPNINFTFLPTVGMVNEEVTFSSSYVLTPASWFWDFGDGNSAFDDSSVQTHVYNETGIFNVVHMVENEYGCSDTANNNITIITEITVPNVFTPNGDGVNDVFYVEGLEFVENCELKVYNRWGRIVYESNNYLNNWDGGNVAEGTYYFVLVIPGFMNLEPISGSVSIFR